MTHMDEVLAKAEEWRANGERVALATVVGARRSAPRPLGAKLVVTDSGRLFGSVSGGCVEADLAARASALLKAGSCELINYGIADDEAWSVGLPCGGEIDVFVEPFGGAPPLERGTSYVVIAGEGIGERWHDDADVQTGLREESRRTVFVEHVSPPPRLLVIGAGDLAEALCALAKTIGWHTVVADPRAGLATRERVPSADELIVAWPDELEINRETALVSFVHEARLEVPVLKRAVESGAFYVGALGSKRRQEKLRAELGDAADRVHGPIGLDLGAQTSAEIALEVMAELLAAWRLQT
jgi:xanthine dehydrogenase accessory factor